MDLKSSKKKRIGAVFHGSKSIYLAPCLVLATFALMVKSGIWFKTSNPYAIYYNAEIL